MSEAFSEEPLKELDSDLLGSMAEFDDSRRVLYGLLTTIASDLPDEVRYEDALIGVKEELSTNFAELVVAIDVACDRDEAEVLTASLWLMDDNERNAMTRCLVRCSCLGSFTKVQVEKNVFNIFAGVYDSEELYENSKRFYDECLKSDLKSFVGHVQELRELPYLKRKIFRAQQMMDAFDTEYIGTKALQVSKYALGVSAAGIIMLKLLNKEEQA